MNWNIFLIGSALVVVGWVAWTIWFQDSTYQKRKNEDLGFAEKPKRKRHIEPERETLEHTHIVNWPSTIHYPDGGTTRWAGLTKSELLELEFGEVSLGRINQAIEQAEETNAKLQEAIQHMKDMSAEYEIHPLSELMADQPKPPEPPAAKQPPSHTSMTR